MVVVPECRGAGCWLREVWLAGNDVLRQMNIAGLKSPFLSVGTTYLHICWSYIFIRNPTIPPFLDGHCER